jgi:hypothetical protein
MQNEELLWMRRLYQLRRMTHGDWFIKQIKRSQKVSSRSIKRRKMPNERWRDTRQS